jgi:glycopeptide antibiotics resistance protein
MRKRLVTALILIAYAAILIKILVFKSLSFRLGHLKFNFSGTSTGAPNFIPFKTIVPYLQGDKGAVIGLFELVGNIGLLVPVGLLAPFICRRMTGKKALVLALASGLAIEGMQVLFKVGIFDVDDVILNAIGVLIGYGIWRLATRNNQSGQAL